MYFHLGQDKIFLSTSFGQLQLAILFNHKAIAPRLAFFSFSGIGNKLLYNKIIAPRKDDVLGGVMGGSGGQVCRGCCQQGDHGRAEA